MNRLILLLIFIMALATSVKAQTENSAFQRAIKLFQERRFAESQSLLSKLVRQEPRKAIYWFNLGNAYYMQQKYRQAAICFDNVVKLGSPLKPAAMLYRAKALRESRDFEKAASQLDLLSRIPDLPQALQSELQAELDKLAETDNDDVLKERALQQYRAGHLKAALQTIASVKSADEHLALFKNLIEEARARTRGDLNDQRRKWVFLDASVGYNSNSYFDGKTTTPYGAPMARTTFGIGGSAWKRAAWSILANYVFDWEEVSQAGDLQSLSHQVSTVVNRETARSLLQTGPYFKYDSWGGNPSVIKLGGRLRVRRNFNSLEIGSDIDYYSTKAQSSQRAYLDGDGTEARVYFGVIRIPFYGQVYADYERQSIGDQTYFDGSVLPAAFQGWGGGGRLVWKTSEKWIFVSQLSIKTRDYFTRAQPNNKARSDFETGVAVRATRALSRNFSIYAAAAYMRNSSSLGSGDVKNENYEVQKYFLGIMWETP